MKNLTIVCIAAMVFAMGGNSSRVYAQTFQPIPRFSIEDIGKTERRGDGNVDQAYKASRWFLRGATALDLTSTVIGMESSHDSEVGWARCFGRHNAAAVTLANGIVDFGVELASQRMYRMGGRWRFVAIAMNAARATGIASDGIHNIVFIRH